jgi:hypothetical protein
MKTLQIIIIGVNEDDGGVNEIFTQDEIPEAIEFLEGLL